MSSGTVRKADTGKTAWRYERRREFLDLLASQDRSLPDYVRPEFDEFLECGQCGHTEIGWINCLGAGRVY